MKRTLNVNSEDLDLGPDSATYWYLNLGCFKDEMRK